MPVPIDWQNPIIAAPGEFQQDVSPIDLLPSRPELVRSRLEFQKILLLTDQVRTTPILVTPGGVIYDGHHGVRAAAEEAIAIDVLIIDADVAPIGETILNLPVR